MHNEKNSDKNLVHVQSIQSSFDSNYWVIASQLSKAKKILPLFDYAPLAAEKFEKELKKITDKTAEKTTEKNNSLKSIQTIEIGFEGEGCAKILIFPDSKSDFDAITAFSFQTEIRKSCGEILTPESGKDASEKDIWVHVEGLPKASQTEFLDFIFSLAGINEYRPTVFGKKLKSQEVQKKLNIKVTSNLSPKELNKTVEQGRVISSAMNRIRTLADLPGNELTPAIYRKKLEDICKNKKFNFEFIDTKGLQKKGAEAFLAVVSADANSKGGVAILRNKKKKVSKSAKKLALVGKGLCFDTGGYNVKTGAYMEDMHRDMTGSAVALAVFEAIAELDMNIEVEAYLALAENHISPLGYKPNDVVTACNGVSIEVIDTDAEGRMVLSDTLAIASESKPDLIVDFATLTGAAVRALDTRMSAVFSNHKKLGMRAVEIGESCGERVWNFPIGDDYNDALKSDVADVRQCAASSNCDHIYAATFLSKFVDAQIPWLHVDLVCAENKGGLGLAKTNTTGWGVRFTLNLVQELIESKLT
jgi:leucyl aminopeptidase